MAKGVSGLSRTERHIIQDNGEVGTGDFKNGELATWKHRILKKIPNTFTDTILLLTNSKGRIDYETEMLIMCAPDIIELNRLTANLIKQHNLDKLPNMEYEYSDCEQNNSD